jgi:hypothetical protein
MRQKYQKTVPNNMFSLAHFFLRCCHTFFTSANWVAAQRFEIKSSTDVRGTLSEVNPRMYTYFDKKNVVLKKTFQYLENEPLNVLKLIVDIN